MGKRLWKLKTIIFYRKLVFKQQKKKLSKLFRYNYVLFSTNCFESYLVFLLFVKILILWLDQLNKHQLSILKKIFDVLFEEKYIRIKSVSFRIRIILLKRPRYNCSNNVHTYIMKQRIICDKYHLLKWVIIVVETIKCS